MPPLPRHQRLDALRVPVKMLCRPQTQYGRWRSRAVASCQDPAGDPSSNPIGGPQERQAHCCDQPAKRPTLAALHKRSRDKEAAPHQCRCPCHCPHRRPRRRPCRRPRPLSCHRVAIAVGCISTRTPAACGRALPRPGGRGRHPRYAGSPAPRLASRVSRRRRIHVWTLSFAFETLQHTCG